MYLFVINTRTELFVGVIVVLGIQGVISDYKNEFSKLDWWQKAIFYQVYPRSFKDSNGDGIGDLKGIEEMADYFAELGVGGIWMNPIFKSPMVDFGYDISNYTEIHEIFGTIDDLRSLKKKLDTLGIKMILDFVPNHTSNESIWFQNSIKKIHPYTDYYVWKDPKGFDKEGNPIPPNNWLQVFDFDSAWTWNDERKQFYLHQFLKEQPDLNYRCPEVLKAMEDVFIYWLDVGIDGFRIDAIDYLVEHKDFPDEVFINPNKSHLLYHNLYHNYTMDQVESLEIARSWRVILDNYTKANNVSTRIMLTEAYTELEITMRFYGTKEKPISHVPFNFEMISNVSPQSNAKDIVDLIQQWCTNMPAGMWPNWVVGNHDNNRVSKTYGVEMTDAINMLVTLLPGTAINYYGEEIGMENMFVRWDQTVDPAGLIAGEELYLRITRDPQRTPMQWNNEFNSGFSTSKHTWLPTNPNYWKINVEKQRKDDISHLKVYKKLSEARNLPTFQFGDMHIETQGNWTIVFTRTYEKHPTYVVVINMATEITYPDLNNLNTSLPSELYVYTSSINSFINEGEKISTTGNQFWMRPKTAVVLTTAQVLTSKSESSPSKSLSVPIFILFGVIWLSFR